MTNIVLASAGVDRKPMVPVAHNAGSFWPRRGFLKRPGTIRVVFGPVIDPCGQTAEEIIKQAEEWVENKMVELESESRRC